VGIMAKTDSISIRFNKDTLNNLSKLMNSNAYKTTTSKVEGCIELLNIIYLSSERKLKQYFTYNEINFLISALENFHKNIIYSSNLNLQLIELFEKSLENNNKILLVNVDRLRWKLKKLNEVDSFMIINKIVDYWEKKNSENPIKIEDLNLMIKTKNIYSIDICFQDNVDTEMIKNKVILELQDEVDILNINLNEVKPSQYNNVSIVIDTKQELDIISKLELKDRIYKLLKDIDIKFDININDVY